MSGVTVDHAAAAAAAATAAAAAAAVLNPLAAVWPPPDAAADDTAVATAAAADEYCATTDAADVAAAKLRDAEKGVKTVDKKVQGFNNDARNRELDILFANCVSRDKGSDLRKDHEKEEEILLLKACRTYDTLEKRSSYVEECRDAANVAHERYMMLLMLQDVPFF